MKLVDSSGVSIKRVSVLFEYLMNEHARVVGRGAWLESLLWVSIVDSAIKAA